MVPDPFFLNSILINNPSHRTEIMHRTHLFLFVAFLVVPNISANADNKQIRVGIIGLDTSHAVHFSTIMNDSQSTGELAHCRVVAAYPQGSADIKSSVSRIPVYTKQVEKLGVEIVPSIDDLLEKVDVVLLETNDGRPHLKQAIPCLQAGKPIFIDKPMAASLVDVLAIFAVANRLQVPLFTSSSLRYATMTQTVRQGSIGKVSECSTQSPASLESTHPDLYWYGIHGVESLFTVMGKGCLMVSRGTYDRGKIEVVGHWSDNRKGVFREGKGYRGTATGEKGQASVGSYDGYEPLVHVIAKFFRTGEVPIDPNETIEIYAFMTAADESKNHGGSPVTLESVLAKAASQVEQRLAEFETD